MKLPLQFAQLRADTTSPAPRSLLRPLDGSEKHLEYDQLQRYSHVAAILDRMLGSLARPIRILEVGCNVLNLLPRFLDSRRVQVTSCDVERFRTDDDFVLIERDQPLPFPSGSFDAVVALEVLEHIEQRDRPSFLADCLRVAAHGAVFSCPNGEPQVIAAERWAAAAYRDRHGQPHPYLAEHVQFGLPRESEVSAYLGALECSFAVFDNAPLDDWLSMLVLSEVLHERAAPEEIRAQIQDILSEIPRRPGIPYRKIYVCAKSFDASQALEPDPFTGARASSEVEVPGVFSRLAELTSTALVENLRTQEELHVAYQDKSTLLVERTKNRDALLEECRQRQVILHSLLSTLTSSLKWRLGAPLRAVRQLLRPRRLDASALIPIKHLVATPSSRPGTWTSTGNDPQLLAPCLFPQGWLRIRLHMRTSVQSRVEIHIDNGLGFREDACLERIQLRRVVKREFYAYLKQPACALRLDPLDAEGEFSLEEFSVEHVPAPKAFFGALGRKLRLLYQYQVMGRTFRNGLVMLARGDLAGVRDKILLGLNRATAASYEMYDRIQAYADWCDRTALTAEDREAMRAEVAAMVGPPVISILTPVYNTPAEYLRLAIDSVRRQIYPHWELCLADDASTEPHVRAILDEYAAADSRIRVTYRPSNGNIAMASNTALSMARGEYVALLDHDDELAEQALFRMAQAIVSDRDIDFLYSDEDKLELDGSRVDPFFKPDWSPEYFLSCMYTCHLGVYRTKLVREIGGFRPEFDTAQDYDMALRLVARAPKIHHVSDVLYHWRKLPTSTAASHAAKPRAHEVSRRAVQSYLDSIGKPARVLPGPVTGFHRVRYKIQGQPLVSIVLPTAGRRARIRGRETSYLATCVDSVRERSTYKNYEIVAIDNNDLCEELVRFLVDRNVRRVSFTEPFNLASKMNLGAAKALGDYLLFLNDDIEVMAPDWIESMLEYAQQPEIGAVGAKLFFPDGRLQHVGVTILDRNPGHPFYGTAGENPGYFCGNVVARNYSAVTGACLMTRAEVFQQSGGFSEALPLNYNDVDLCLRIREMGLRIVYVPYASLYHHESASKEGVHQSELEAFRELWVEKLARDPYYNPNLTNLYSDFRVAGKSEPLALEGGGR